MDDLLKYIVTMEQYVDAWEAVRPIRDLPHDLAQKLDELAVPMGKAREAVASQIAAFRAAQ